MAIGGDLPTIQVSDPDVQRMQSQLNSRVNQLSQIILNNGVLVKAALTSGSNQVQHRLGQKYQGYFVIGQDAASQIYDATAATSGADPGAVIVLNSSASGTVNVSLWVF